MNYYINRGGQQSGPYSLPDLQNMMAQGQVAPNDAAWCEGMPSWIPVSQVLASMAPQQAYPQQYGQPQYPQQQYAPQGGAYTTGTAPAFSPQANPGYPTGFAPQYFAAGRAEAGGYGQVCGILGLILAITGFVIPIVGVLFITPLAFIMGVFALRGHSKNMGIAILIVNVINLLISPTFWLNIGAGAFSAGNTFLTLFDVAGVVVMFILVIRKQQFRTS